MHALFLMNVVTISCIVASDKRKHAYLLQFVACARASTYCRLAISSVAVCVRKFMDTAVTAEC